MTSITGLALSTETALSKWEQTIRPFSSASQMTPTRGLPISHAVCFMADSSLGYLERRSRINSALPLAHTLLEP